MPRYFFHFETEGVRVRDEVGLALPDEEAAWYQAVRNARDLIHAERTIGGASWKQSVEIEDERGMPVDRLPLQDVAGFVSLA